VCGPSPHTPIEETLEALHDVVKVGKARYLGASSILANLQSFVPGRSRTGGRSVTPSARPAAVIGLWSR
jgi:hypothetical protein